MNCIIKYIQQNLLFNFTVLIILATLSCQKKENKENLLYAIDCDVSTLNTEGKQILTLPNDSIVEVNLGGIKSQDKYHSAPYSILLTGNSQYSFGTNLDEIQTNQYFKISIWRRDKLRKAGLVVISEPQGILYEGADEIVEVGKDGWEKIQVEIEVPPGVQGLKLFTLKGRADSAYFDDLKIECFQKKIYPSYNDTNHLNIYFTDAQMSRLKDERKKAFLEGVHFSNDSWEKAVFSDEKNVYPIKARLKGDWLDHLQGKKWSFRIKMRSDNAFKRMKSFSLQTPKSRFFLHEFIAHRILDQEDILTTRYSFTPLNINKESVGIYAIEEHFAKQLVEYNKRREGPILKFDEDPFWHNNAFDHGTNKLKDPHPMPHFSVSRILPFGEGKLLESPSLMKQFKIAHSLAMQYKHAKNSADELFDIDKMARYLALIDIINGKHGLAWHNQRFYYNPVICKLEPINFDNFVDNVPINAKASPRANFFIKNAQLIEEKRLMPFLYSSNALVSQYIAYLERYSKEDFIINAYNSMNGDLMANLDLIKREFPTYNVSVDFLLKNAASIRSYLPELKSKFADGHFEQILNEEIINEKATPMKQVSILTSYVNCYYFLEENQAKLLIENYNGHSIEAIGLLTKDGQLAYRFAENIKLPFFSESAADTLLDIRAIDEVDKLVFKLKGEATTYTAKVTPWSKNTELSPYQKLIRSDSSRAENLFKLKGDTFLLEKGNYVLNHKIYVPNNKVVQIEAGVTLDLRNGAAVLSFSKVHLKGTEDQPIKIYSSDKSANGFNVFQTAGVSTIEHTIFSGLNTLDYDGWSLTGAVNFYEADVSIQSTVFEDNQCEDALNIIRSDFSVTDSKFLNIFADAFDSDFCTGELMNSIFEQVGNDAIDFSTSQIDISSCVIRNISDKGISGGEESTLKVWDCEISNCSIGIASKDLSEVNVSNTNITDCDYGFVALRKKTEYGPAKILAKSVTISNCTTKHLIEHSSELILNNRRIVGTEKNVAALFY